MNRITLFEKDGKIMCQQERLSKAPSGNAGQRKKQLAKGWKPDWVKCGIATHPDYMEMFNKGVHVTEKMGTLTPPPEIASALEIVHTLSAVNRVFPHDEPDFYVREFERIFCVNSGL